MISRAASGILVPSSQVKRDDAMKKIRWSGYQDMVVDLDRGIRSRFPDDGEIFLVGIPRGGLLLALHLTYLSKRYEIVPAEDFDFDPERLVIVDDVLESGKTMEHWLGFLDLDEDPVIAVLVDKTACYPGVRPADICHRRASTKEWVLFPYEMEEDEGKRAAVHEANCAAEAKL